MNKIINKNIKIDIVIWYQKELNKLKVEWLIAANNNIKDKISNNQVDKKRIIHMYQERFSKILIRVNMELINLYSSNRQQLGNH